MANQIQNVGFQAGPYSGEQAEIDRRRQYAQALTQQGMQPMGETQMAGGWAIPNSPTQGLAKMLQAYSGRKGQEDADEKQKELGERYQADMGTDRAQLIAALNGTPSTMYEDASGNAAPTDARAPDPQALQTMNFRSPMFQQMQAQQLATQLQPKEVKAYKPGDVLYQGGKQVGAIPAAPKFHNVGGNLVPEPAPGAPAGPINPVYSAPDKDKDAWGEPYVLDGAQVQKNSRTGEIRTAVSRPPVTNNTLNAPPASQVFNNENKLRDDYTAATKSFTGIRDAYNTVSAALSGPITAVSTLAGATKFMKMIDPESVVRESELNMALKATGMLDRFMNLHNTVLKGQVLTPNQAKEIQNISRILYDAAEKQQAKTDEYFSGLATQYGLSPDRVIRKQGAVMRNDPQRRSTDPLTSDEQKELADLRKRFGTGQPAQ